MDRKREARRGRGHLPTQGHASAHRDTRPPGCGRPAARAVWGPPGHGEGTGMNIYVASSWRNTLQPELVILLRQAGHEVYDFRHPAPGNEGFHWEAIDPQWQQWTPQQYREALQHPIAQAGYALDMAALTACDACVLVLPSGRSASYEFGRAIGAGKRGAIV